MPTGATSVTGPSSSRPGPTLPDGAVIELDVRHPPDAEDTAAPLRLGRRAKAALIALLSVLTLTAAAPPERGLIRMADLGDRSASAVALSPTAAYAATVDASAEISTVRRYALDGLGTAETWATELGGRVVDGMDVAHGAGVLLASSYSGGGIDVLDARTGDALWSDRDARAMRILDDTVLLAIPGEPDLLRMVSLRTGATVWSRTFVTGSWDIDTRSAPGSLVTVEQDGTASTYSLADGRLAARADLGFTPAQAERNFERDFTETAVVDGTLYVARRIGDRATLAAYPLATLELQWRRPGPAGAVNECLPYICVGDDKSVSVVDRISGKPLWTDTRWSYVYGDAPGALLATDRSAEPVTTLVNPARGTPLRTLGEGAAVGGSPLIYVRTRQGERTAQVLAVSRDDGTVRVAGDIGPVTPYRCATAGAYLTCPTPGGPQRIWRLPS
jgi:outer membrane protein assembly factor BamB